MALWDAAAAKLAAARTRRAVARRLAELDVAPNRTLRDEIEEWAAEHRDRLALVSADGSERLTYADLAGRAARWARWTILHGVARGEAVALLMANRPERVAAWIGIAASGAVADLLDPALDGPALAAAIAAAAPRHLVVDGALLARFETAAPHLAVMTAVWVHGPHSMAYLRIDEALDDLSPERLRPADRRPVAAGDAALRIRGTAPAGPLDHRGVIRAMHAAAAACGATRDDRLDLSRSGLGDPAAVLAVGIATTTGGIAVTAGVGTPSVRDETATATLAVDGPSAGDPSAARPRLVFAIGATLGATVEPGAAGAPRRLLWCDGALWSDTGDRLWTA